MNDDELIDLSSGQTYDTVSSEWAFERASRENLLVAVPGISELFIDIDNEHGLSQFETQYRVLLKFRPRAQVTRNTPSPSGEPGHFHIVVDLGESVDPLERCLLQAILGSDPKRELLSWQRLNNQDEVPTLFFELDNSSTIVDSDIPF